MTNPPPSSATPVFTDLAGPDVLSSPSSTPAAKWGKFALGRLLATPGALALLTEFGVSPLTLLMRHASGDWGELDDRDRQVNELAVVHGDRILSAYVLRRVELGQTVEARVWVITEADRAVTTVLRPSDY